MVFDLLTEQPPCSNCYEPTYEEVHGYSCSYCGLLWDSNGRNGYYKSGKQCTSFHGKYAPIRCGKAEDHEAPHEMDGFQW